jgi:hypothetical protein
VRRLHIFGVVGAIVAVAVVALIISKRAPTPPPEDRSDEFKPSDACMAEARATRIENYPPPCFKQEADAWLFDSCLKRWNDDADLCRNMVKAITCLDQDQLDEQCNDAIEAVKQAESLQQQRRQP